MEDKNELIVPESTDLSILTDPEKVAKAREELNKESLALISKIVEETSIEKTGIASQNSEIIFDLQGRRVEKPNKPGIYIVGGRKLVIK